MSIELDKKKADEKEEEGKESTYALQRHWVGKKLLELTLHSNFFCIIPMKWYCGSLNAKEHKEEKFCFHGDTPWTKRFIT